MKYKYPIGIKLGFFILLILQFWTPLSGISQVSNDTVRCYGVTELRQIALTLTKGAECDTLLKVSELQLKNRDSLILLKDNTISNYRSESAYKEAIISVKNQHIDTINLQLKKTTRKLNWTKAGWMFTTLLLLTSTGYFIIH